MWVTKLMISQVKKRIFCPKTTKFGPKLAFLVNLGQAMQAYSVPSWWVGWWLWRAGCISQDTYLLYLLDNSLNQSKWSGWSFWSVLLGAEDGQGVQRRVVNKENCGIVGFMGTLMIRHACTLTDRQWKVGPS